METSSKERARLIEREQGFWNARGESTYDRIRGLIGRAIGEYSSYAELDRVFDPAGLRVLDYGCGQGEQALALVARGAGHVTGFDIAEAEVEQARTAAARAGVADRTTFLVADAHATPFAGASFDLVVGHSILHHLELEPALREIRRVLRPGGRALFAEPLWHNPLLRLGRRLTPSARTVDEHPLTERDWQACARVFEHFEHFERELVSIPLMPLNLLLPSRAQRPLARAVRHLDARLMSRFPALRKHARLTFLVLHQRLRIDLHSHVLPGLDDGPADVDGAIALARAAVEDGTTTLAATPHLRLDHPAVRPEELAGRLADLRTALTAESVELELVGGGEVDVVWANRASDEELRLASYGQRGSDILVEVPYGPLAPIFEDMLFTLTSRGYRILLAHPERSPTFIRDPERLHGLVQRGTLLQVTAAALASRDRRSRSRRLAANLVREGLAHVIASDAHSAAAPRSPSLAAGVAAAARDAPGRAEWMVTDAPAAIIAGEPLPPAPSPSRAGRLPRLLRGRHS